ncbi:ATP-grasp ribosomal peptide maturase [Streptomyces sp. NPDC056500]|uniref:ATP-grasp ribosomal peptide maturase n=1 Tax=Streptomyces sp. NPDC056500 TaxID=3345840 RepID=UPI0036ABC8F6
MPILVIAARDEWPTDRVVRALADRGAEVFRMDIAEFPQNLTFAGRIDARRGWSGGLASPVRSLDLAEVTAVYYRAPNSFRFPEGMSDAERGFAAAQARFGFGGVLTALDCRWVNHPASMSQAEYKPTQLAAARMCGLNVPSTLITNDPAAVRDFAAEANGPIICKPLSSPALVEDNHLTTIYTRVLTEQDLLDLRGIETTAHLFQQWVEKDYEVRLTVVGDCMFAAKINAGTTQAYIDWRADYRALTYLATQVPVDTADAVRRLMRRLNLRFGALDFVVSSTGKWTFLEVNPCGQWDWIQNETDLPIAEAIADELLGAPT